MPERLYNNYGSTQLQFDIRQFVDPKIHGLVSELMNLMKEYDVDPRDFKLIVWKQWILTSVNFFVDGQ